MIIKIANAENQRQTLNILIFIFGVDFINWYVISTKYFIRYLTHLVYFIVCFLGWLFDVSGNYDNTFYSAGSCICIAGVLVVLTMFVKSQ